MKQNLLQKIGIKHPIIQAPMAGGATTPELVAAVSNTGGLGSLAGALLSPAKLIEATENIRKLTDAPFSVNLFVLETPTPTQDVLDKAQQNLVDAYTELDLVQTKANCEETSFCIDNRSQIETLLELAPAVVSFAFGLLSKTDVAAFHARGSLVVGTATHLQEALAWQKNGADAVCAQGSEAGGHRGTFIGKFEEANIGSMALISTLVSALEIPVIAAGGIMNGQTMAAALHMGAELCQLGTAFLTTTESGIHPLYKAKLMTATDNSTRVTRLFSGKPARGLVNKFMQENAELETIVPAYPIQNALTGQLRGAANQQNNADYMSLWAGQGVHLSRAMSAADLVSKLVDELG